MIKKIEGWIDHTLEDFKDEKISCRCFSDDFKGFYPFEFLSKSFFVVVKKVPRPDFPEIRKLGLSEFIDMNPEGITYKNTYFVKKGRQNDLGLHFHELVHVLQWQYLEPKDFISRYIEEIQEHGYDNAPLEVMAYMLQTLFSEKIKTFDVQDYVQANL